MGRFNSLITLTVFECTLFSIFTKTTYVNNITIGNPTEGFRKQWSGEISGTRKSDWGEDCDNSVSKDPEVREGKTVSGDVQKTCLKNRKRGEERSTVRFAILISQPKRNHT